MNDEEIRQQINDIIEGEIQNGINEYLESQEQEKSNEGGVGFVNNEEGAKQLNVKVSQAEVDRLVKVGGFLSIIDFETPYPYSKKYAYKDGIYSHKQNNSDVFIASNLYSVVNKYHFSHENFFFDKEINERVSLTLLCKESKIFDGS